MNSPFRLAGHAAIASGIIGIAAYIFLVGFLVFRNLDAQHGVLPIRLHDSCVIMQFLLLIPVVIAIVKLSGKIASDVLFRRWCGLFYRIFSTAHLSKNYC
jgi:hypothetical protein